MQTHQSKRSLCLHLLLQVYSVHYRYRPSHVSILYVYVNLDRRNWHMCGRATCVCRLLGGACVCTSSKHLWKEFVLHARQTGTKLNLSHFVATECLNRVICFALSFPLLSPTPNKGLLSVFNWNAGLHKRWCTHTHTHAYTHRNIIQHTKSMQQTLSTHTFKTYSVQCVSHIKKHSKMDLPCLWPVKISFEFSYFDHIHYLTFYIKSAPWSSSFSLSFLYSRFFLPFLPPFSLIPLIPSFLSPHYRLLPQWTLSNGGI